MYYLEAQVNLKQDQEILQLLEDVTDVFSLQKYFGILSQSLLMVTHFLAHENSRLSMTIDQSEMAVTISTSKTIDTLALLKEDSVLNQLVDDIKIEEKQCRLNYSVHVQKNDLSDARKMIFKQYQKQSLIDKYGLVELKNGAQEND